jgi:hypothetical protein
VCNESQKKRLGRPPRPSAPPPVVFCTLRDGRRSVAGPVDGGALLADRFNQLLERFPLASPRLTRPRSDASLPPAPQQGPRRPPAARGTRGRERRLPQQRSSCADRSPRPRLTSSDRDGDFGSAAHGLLGPWRSARRSSVSQGERHLVRAPRDYVRDYHGDRPHIRRRRADPAPRRTAVAREDRCVFRRLEPPPPLREGSMGASALTRTRSRSTACRRLRHGRAGARSMARATTIESRPDREAQSTKRQRASSSA